MHAGGAARIGRSPYRLPYAKVEPRPGAGDRVVQVAVDPELGREGFTFGLESGKQGSVHMDQVLDYCRDPSYLRDLLLYTLTLEARGRIDDSGLSRREIIRRLGTSPAQLYRLLDQTNYRKSVDQLLSLLTVLDCEFDLVVRKKEVHLGKEVRLGRRFAAAALRATDS